MAGINPDGKDTLERKMYVLDSLYHLSVFEKDNWGKIEDYLNQARELGMHQADWKIEWKKPGVTMDVPRFINNLCEEYDVGL